MVNLLGLEAANGSVFFYHFSFDGCPAKAEYVILESVESSQKLIRWFELIENNNVYCIAKIKMLCQENETLRSPMGTSDCWQM
jgi:hypothetical protein